jgi:hypothetical protein
MFYVLPMESSRTGNAHEYNGSPCYNPKTGIHKTSNCSRICIPHCWLLLTSNSAPLICFMFCLWNLVGLGMLTSIMDLHVITQRLEYTRQVIVLEYAFHIAGY